MKKKIRKEVPGDTKKERMGKRTRKIAKGGRKEKRRKRRELEEKEVE